MDDKNTLVVDIGSASVKVGYAGENQPTVLPAVVTNSLKYRSEAIECNLDNNNSIHPIERGIIKNKDQLSSLWGIISEELDLQDKETSTKSSILIVESSRTTAKDRMDWAEILFESHYAPSICFCNSAAASIFASGRTTGLSIDSGAGITSVTPVYEGLPLKYAQGLLEFGGQDISHYLYQQLNSQRIPISFSDAKVIKEERAAIIQPTEVDSPRSYDTCLTTLVLPDGNEVKVDEKIFTDCTNSLFYDEKLIHKGLVNQTYESISLCDDSLKKQMFNNIILSGGNSQIKGFGDRLRAEISEKLSMDMTFKVGPQYDVSVIPNSIFRESGYTRESKYAAWIGASMVGTMDTYKDIKITRQEYEENAVNAISTKYM